MVRPRSRRITLELSEETYQALAKLARENSKTMTEVVREGLALRSFAEEQKREGKQLAVIVGDKIDTKIVLT